MTTGEQPNRASLYRKIAAVAGAIAAVAKDGYNPQLKYKYATPATVMEAVKPLLAEQHLAIVPTMSQVIKEPTGSKTQSGAEKVLTRVEMIYLILDGESGESLSVPWAGEGEDWSDKGIAKAQTIALRTFLIQLFQIPAEDAEIDPDARQVQTPQQPARSAPQRPQQARPANGTRMPVVSRSALEAAPGASYEPPPTTLAEIERDEAAMRKIGPLPRAPEAAPAKKPPTREGMLKRIEDLTAKAEELDLEIELKKPLSEMTEAELVQHGRNLNAAIAEAEARDIQPVAA